jgi:hypothetical protein
MQNPLMKKQMGDMLHLVVVVVVVVTVPLPWTFTTPARVNQYPPVHPEGWLDGWLGNSFPLGSSSPG